MSQAAPARDATALPLPRPKAYSGSVPRRYLLNEFFDSNASSFRLSQERFDRREPASNEVELKVAALSLNYRDLMILRGQYNPRLKLPTTIISDAAGEVVAVGSEVSDLKPGDRVLTNFANQWLKGPFHAEYLKHTLGTPGPGLASEYQYLPEQALLKIPDNLSFEAAATLPVAGLTAYSALVSEGRVQPGHKVLTLGTGGVSLFVLALGQRLGVDVAITSSSDQKLARCRELGAAFTLNYRKEEQWGKAVAQWAQGCGVDLVVETGGAQTLAQSIRATRAGGRIAILGALTGLRAPIDLGPIMMRRISLHGVMVDSREALACLVDLCTSPKHGPVFEAAIAKTFPFEDLDQALAALASGRHMGKIVISLEA